MSKSLGNGVSVEDLANAGSWPAIRYWLASAQYRSNLDYSQTSISEAQVALDRIVGFLKRAAQASQEAVDFSKIPEAFRDAMNSDLNVPGALSVLHERVRAGNIAFDSNDYQNLSECVQEVRAMVQVLGLAFATEEPDVSDELKVKVEELIARRQVAKVSKDFALADEIRAELEELGVTLKDMKDITMWSFNG